MEFRILDKNFVDMMVLDTYESLLWVDRYDEPGDFEIYAFPSDDLLKYAVDGNYIYSKDSEHMMIIEYVSLTQSFDEGKRVIIKGRSLESILDRRILWYKTQFRKNLEDAIRQILDFSIIKPDDDDRKISNFVFEYSHDPTINSINVDLEYELGTDLLTCIKALCKSAGVGFKITFNGADNTFVFKLYNGKDRSYNQYSNPYVVFSSRFDNIITNEFVNDSTNFKNVIRTIGSSQDGEKPKDFIVSSVISNNIIVVDADEYRMDAGSSENDKNLTFQFSTGKLKIEGKYTFTCRVNVNEGDVSRVTVRLTSPPPYARIYASQTLEIQNGRIYGTFTVGRPDLNYDDCYNIVIYDGEAGSTAGNSISISELIFSPGNIDNNISGLYRREFYNDASSVDYTEEMTENDYIAQLYDSAYDVLQEKIVKTEVDGSVEDKVSYSYNKDYFIGDIVQVENDFGILGTMRVTEFITSHSSSGIEMYPTFKTYTKGEDS